MTEEQLEKIAYLNRAYYIKRKINALNGIKSTNKSVKAVKYESDGTQHVGGYNREEERMMRVLELDEKIAAEKDKLYIMLNEIYDAISKVDDIELNTILTYRYLNYMKFEDIAEKMNYDERTIRKKHKKALDKIAL